MSEGTCLGAASSARAAGAANARGSWFAQDEFQAHTMRLFQLRAFVRRGYDRWEATRSIHDRPKARIIIHLPARLLSAQNQLVCRTASGPFAKRRAHMEMARPAVGFDAILRKDAKSANLFTVKLP